MIYYPFDGTEPCTEIGTDMFFPTEDAVGAYREVVAICHTCHHQAECLQYALVNDCQHGVFGGLAPRDRRHLRPSGRVA